MKKWEADYADALASIGHHQGCMCRECHCAGERMFAAKVAAEQAQLAEYAARTARLRPAWTRILDLREGIRSAHECSLWVFCAHHANKIPRLRRELAAAEAEFAAAKEAEGFGIEEAIFWGGE